MRSFPGISSFVLVGFVLGAAPLALAQSFEIRSPDIAQGATLTRAQVYSGYGCKGGNLSPAILWTNVPPGTKSFAFTVFDPDAPTGHGWWHWLVIDIPASATGLPRGAAKAAALPTGARETKNDFDDVHFGGACPPEGDKPHRYEFTVHALQVERIDVPAGTESTTPPQTIEEKIRANEIGSARITARYGR